MTVRLLLTLATAVTASLATGEIAPPAPSGVEGIISVSPSRPGPIRKGETSTAPAAKVEFVVKSAAVQVTSFTTDGEGRFHIPLAPGHYIILREDAAAIGHWQFEVDVIAGGVTKVKWCGDSGMR